MKTARELFEQADALMRRNRKHGKDKGGGPPTLTDALGIERGGTLAPTILLPEAAQTVVLSEGVATDVDPIALDTLSDLPVLTDVVDVWQSPASTMAPQSEAGAKALADAIEADALAANPAALEMATRATHDKTRQPAPVEAMLRIADEPPPRPDTSAQAAGTSDDAVPDEVIADGPMADHAITDGTMADRAMADGAMADGAMADRAIADGAMADGTIQHVGKPDVADRNVPPAAGGAIPAVATPPLLEEEFILEIPPATDEVATTPRPAAVLPPGVEPVPTMAPGSLEWGALAEEIRMQVLQRLDLFTDTGMRDQLGARLRPIVDRASAELVETINHELGELVRGYVAEAIEREIESWRKRSG